MTKNFSTYCGWTIGKFDDYWLILPPNDYDWFQIPFSSKEECIKEINNRIHYPTLYDPLTGKRKFKPGQKFFFKD